VGSFQLSFAPLVQTSSDATGEQDTYLNKIR